MYIYFLVTMGLKTVIFNIIGGILVILLDRLSIFLCKRYKSRRFKKIFGSDLSNSYKIIYTKYQMAQVYNAEGRVESQPFIKPSLYLRFSINNPIL